MMRFLHPLPLEHGLPQQEEPQDWFEHCMASVAESDTMSDSRYMTEECSSPCHTLLLCLWARLPDLLQRACRGRVYCSKLCNTLVAVCSICVIAKAKLTKCVKHARLPLFLLF